MTAERALTLAPGDGIVGLVFSGDLWGEGAGCGGCRGTSVLTWPFGVEPSKRKGLELKNKPVIKILKTTTTQQKIDNGDQIIFRQWIDCPLPLIISKGNDGLSP